MNGNGAVRGQDSNTEDIEPSQGSAADMVSVQDLQKEMAAIRTEMQRMRDAMKAAGIGQDDADRHRAGEIDADSRTVTEPRFRRVRGESFIDHDAEGLPFFYTRGTRKIEQDLSTRGTVGSVKGKRKSDGPGSSKKKSCRFNSSVKSKVKSSGSGISCTGCKRTGHLVKDCRNKEVICHRCGEKGHYADTCTKPRVATAGVPAGNKTAASIHAGSKTDARPGGKALVKIAEEAIHFDEVIFVTFVVNSLSASVLFGSGANRFSISLAFSSRLGIPSSLLDSPLENEVIVGKSVLVRNKIDGYSITIDGSTFPISLIPIDIGNFQRCRGHGLDDASSC